MADQHAQINVSTAELQKSAVKFQKELLIMPVIGSRETLQHMTPRAGTRGRVVLGEMNGDVELGPYDPYRESTDGVNITPRTLEVFLGSALEKFDPNEMRDTVYGSLVAQGEALKNTEILRAILTLLSGKLAQKLNMAIWSASRNDAGTKTSELFNGFDTIAAKEITAGTISTAKKSLYEFPAVFDEDNAVDELKKFYWNAADELQGRPTKLFMPFSVYNAYNEAYKNVTGAIPYNTEYKKTFLEGSSNLCELVPLVSKKNSPYLQLTTRSNMVYGYGNGLAEERVAIEKYHPFICTFVSTMFFGTQYRSVSPEAMCVGKLKTE